MLRFPQMQPTAVEAVLLVSFSRDPFVPQQQRESSAKRHIRTTDANQVLGSWTCGKAAAFERAFKESPEATLASRWAPAAKTSASTSPSHDAWLESQP